MKNKEKYIKEKMKYHYSYLQKLGYEVVCIMLQGSQNYNLDEYSQEYWSDVDTKAIVLPHFSDFCENKPPVSTTIKLECGEQIDVKDIRTMFGLFRKSNIQFIELLYTKYKIINKKYKKIINEIFERRDEIALHDITRLVKTIAGMAKQKQAALCHPYPTIAARIEEYGYDGKQLSHCVRLLDFLDKFSNNLDIENCYWYEDMDYKRTILMNYKKQKNRIGTKILTKEEAIEICEHCVAAIDVIVAEIVDMRYPEQELPYFDSIIYKILKKWFKRQCFR